MIPRDNQQMPDSELQLCFFISPMGEHDSEERRNSDTVLEVLLQQRLRPLGFDVRRADHLSDIGRIDDQMLDQLVGAELAVCDVTGLNPNVMYELGVRHAVGKPVIVIAAAGTVLPFDTATFRTIFYDLGDVMAMHRAGNELDDVVKLIIEGRHANNPVADRVSRRALESSSGVVEEALARIETMMYSTTKLLEQRDDGLREARFAFDNKSFGQALEFYQAFLEREPGNREGLIGLARTYRRLGRFGDAIAAVEELLEREPKNSQALYNLACYRCLDGRHLNNVFEPLSQAIASAERYRRYAASDPDFESIRDNPEFNACVTG